MNRFVKPDEFVKSITKMLAKNYRDEPIRLGQTIRIKAPRRYTHDPTDPFASGYELTPEGFKPR